MAVHRRCKQHKMQHVLWAEAGNVSGIMTHPAPGQGPLSFGHRLKVANQVTLEACLEGCKQVLQQAPSVFTVEVQYAEPTVNQPAAMLKAFEQSLDLAHVFDAVPSGAGVQYQLTAFTDWRYLHCTAWVLDAGTGSWVHVDDTHAHVVGSWDQVMQACLSQERRPTLLFDTKVDGAAVSPAAAKKATCSKVGSAAAVHPFSYTAAAANSVIASKDAATTARESISYAAAASKSIASKDGAAAAREPISYAAAAAREPVSSAAAAAREPVSYTAATTSKQPASTGGAAFKSAISYTAATVQQPTSKAAATAATDHVSKAVAASQCDALVQPIGKTQIKRKSKGKGGNCGKRK
eukprot:jgi/Chrzof1/7542/Cz02g27200.t1